MAHKRVVLHDVEAAAVESRWVVVDSSTMEGVGRAMEPDVALQAFVATVEADGAWGDGQLTMQLGNLGGQKGWRLGLVRLAAGGMAWRQWSLPLVWCRRLGQGGAGCSG